MLQLYLLRRAQKTVPSWEGLHRKEEETRMTKEKMGKGVKFERIRRITGHLVGTLDKWNNAKKAE
jgi:hypothetical protein